MMNSLTREVGFKVGPVMLEVLVKHYFDRLKKDAENGEDSGQKLKGDDVLYHEAFTIVKSFMIAATSHTVEELQSFSNTRTPSPPWTHVVRTLVPLSCCDEAATYLVKALGGEEVARDLVGGVKWWQVRGVNGIDAQWITAKKDWEEAERKRKMEREQKLKEGLPSPPPMASKHGHHSEGVYEKDMDAMRCILYLHGGGYYFGSVDQERYSIQRHARKINGRVFAINYRLAPQYPFPCALQDAIAAYLYLIQPPPGADHVAVNPAHIIIAGDSAGGGLSIALLQVIRDSGLPLPAGAFLISPWCDLTHSFPSIHLNTNTDIIPETGLSFHKPSTLWPPPPADIATRVHASLRFRIRQAFRLDEHPTQTDTILSEKDFHAAGGAELKTPLVPPVTLAALEDREKVVVQTEAGHSVVVHEQLQFYTQNSLLGHPLVSPVNSYLGGLPPLFITAGEKEVLRDEIIYFAHKAAYPERYPIDERARSLYPVLRGIEKRYKPTSVHLQVYDGTPHILPVLFSFCTPAKFCFRAIASFCKFVTEISPNPIPLTRNAQTTTNIPSAPITRRRSLFTGFKTAPPDVGAATTNDTTGPTLSDTQLTLSPISLTPEGSATPLYGGGSENTPDRPSLRRVLSDRLGTSSGSLFRSHSSLARSRPTTITSKRPSTAPKKGSAEPSSPSSPEPKANETQPFAERLMEKLSVGKENETSISSSDVAGPRFQVAEAPPKEHVERTAGEMEVYEGIKDRSTWECRMIRERVSTSGVVRPLEPEDTLEAFQMSQHRVGNMPEKTIQRYIRDRGIFEKKFAHTMKSIDKVRRHNLEKAKADTIKRMHLLKRTMSQDEDGGNEDGVQAGSNRSSVAANGVNGSGGSNNHNGAHKGKLREKVLSSPGWAWAWALDDSERPPPSSIVSRRDTEEARKLAAVADWATQDEDQTMSANNLWAVVQNFLTATPGKDNHVLRRPRKKKHAADAAVSPSDPKKESREMKRERKSLDESKPKNAYLSVGETSKDGIKRRRSFLDMFNLGGWRRSSTMTENPDNTFPPPSSEAVNGPPSH